MHKKAGTRAPAEESPTNVRCKAPHLIKIILAYSPKKKRADPIEDESEVQQTRLIDHQVPASHTCSYGYGVSYPRGVVAYGSLRYMDFILLEKA